MENKSVTNKEVNKNNIIDFFSNVEDNKGFKKIPSNIFFIFLIYFRR